MDGANKKKEKENRKKEALKFIFSNLTLAVSDHAFLFLSGSWPRVSGRETYGAASRLRSTGFIDSCSGREPLESLSSGVSDAGQPGEVRDKRASL